jgi:uncharacterized membrane protein
MVLNIKKLPKSGYIVIAAMTLIWAVIMLRSPVDGFPENFPEALLGGFIFTLITLVPLAFFVALFFRAFSSLRRSSRQQSEATQSVPHKTSPVSH